MFIDKIQLKISSGHGGKGAVSYRREKFVPQGGPDGGDGGKGGNIVFEVDNNSHTLANFRGQKHLKAPNGVNGKSKNCTGKQGKDLILKVPTGTQIFDSDTNELLLDLINHGDKIIFLKGGKGGLGNTRFKSSVNQLPNYAQSGLQGETKNIRLELKLISDIALVGFPNVGKSTLISVLSNAKPEIANYEFTTLTPKLGTVRIDYIKSFIIADIPGIIEGASDGKGLGLEFLSHIERSKASLFMLDISNYRDIKTQFQNLQIELKKYSQTLFNRDFGIAITKIDIFEPDEVKKIISQLQDISQQAKFIISISAVTGENLEELKYKLFDLI